MRKILTILLSTLFVLSCSKKASDLEIVETSPEFKKETSIVEPSSEMTKPLIKIAKDDILEIYVRADGAPGMFINDLGELEGFYVDLEKEIMKEMGQKYNLNPYTDLGPLVIGIKSGETHSVLSTPDVPDFRALTNISIIYEVLEYVIFFPEKSKFLVPINKEEAIKILYGKKVGVQTRGHMYQTFRDHKDIEIVEYPTTTAALEALNNGEVDAVPDVKRIGKYYAKLNNWEVKAMGAPILSLNIGTAFSKALDSSIVDRYNIALQSLIDSGYVDNLHKSYFGD